MSTKSKYLRNTKKGEVIRYFTLFCLLVYMMSCTKESFDVSVDDALLPYFESFEKEAQSRGINFSVEGSGISGVIINISGNNIIAQCTHSKAAPSRVTVDEDYWKIATDQEKEFYIFHELGHCYLKREHFDAKDDNGNCKSIMHSSADVCTFSYNESTRAEYLNELFNK